MRIVGVHGFNVRDKGLRSIDALGNSLASNVPDIYYDADGADYGFYGLWKVRFRSKPAVRRIAEAIKGAHGVIAHSNGANYTMKALELLKSEGYENTDLKIIFYSPALNVKQPLHLYEFDKLHVFHSESDWIVKLSSWLPFHPWGRAGAKGIKAEVLPEHRLNNIYYEGIHHSDWFTKLSLPTLTKFTAKLL